MAPFQCGGALGGSQTLRVNGPHGTTAQLIQTTSAPNARNAQPSWFDEDRNTLHEGNVPESATRNLMTAGCILLGTDSRRTYRCVCGTRCRDTHAEVSSKILGDSRLGSRAIILSPHFSTSVVILAT